MTRGRGCRSLAEGNMAAAVPFMAAPDVRRIHVVDLGHPALHPRRPDVDFEPPGAVGPGVVPHPRICGSALHLHTCLRRQRRNHSGAPARPHLQRQGRRAYHYSRNPEYPSMRHGGEAENDTNFPASQNPTNLDLILKPKFFSTFSNFPCG